MTNNASNAHRYLDVSYKSKNIVETPVHEKVVQEMEWEKYEGNIDYKGKKYQGEYTVVNGEKIPNGNGFLQWKHHSGKNVSYSGNFENGKFVRGKLEIIHDNENRDELDGEFKDWKPFNATVLSVVKSGDVYKSVKHYQNGHLTSEDLYAKDGKVGVRKGDIIEIYSDNTKQHLIETIHAKGNNETLDLKEKLKESTVKMKGVLDDFRLTILRDAKNFAQFEKDMGWAGNIPENYQKFINVLNSAVEGVSYIGKLNNEGLQYLHAVLQQLIKSARNSDFSDKYDQEAKEIILYSNILSEYMTKK